MSPTPNSTSPQNNPPTSGNLEEMASVDSALYGQLVADFNELYRHTKKLDRAYLLRQKAKVFEEKHGFPAKEYMSLFEVYVEDERTPDFIEQLASQTSRLEPIVRIFQSLASLAIIVSAFQLIAGLEERRSQLIDERWQTIGSGLNAGGGKRRALEFLHEKGELLSNVELIDVQLSALNLPEKQWPGQSEKRGARLQEAVFKGSNLHNAYLGKANLYRSDFSRLEDSVTNLDSVNFQGADLRQANFQGADLQNACFKGANLQEANFTGAHLGNADFRGSRFLEKPQIEAAAKDQTPGIFDAPLSEELGLGDSSQKEAAKGCRIQPKKEKGWLRLW